MLQYGVVHPPTLELLKQLSILEELNGFALAGGTSLALQLGHRVSIDLDFFSLNSFDEIFLLEKLREKYSAVNILLQKKNSLNIFINNIRTDFISHQYPLCKPIINEDGLLLFSMEDIAAMKLSAVASRGSKKDFIDIYFILQHFSLEEILEFMKRKYPELNQMQVLMSLTYFDDAENSLEPVMLIKTDWAEVKKHLLEAVKKFR
jgi:predicted nucleotidyltransferase component of viral defense system